MTAADEGAMRRLMAQPVAARMGAYAVERAR